MTTNQTMTLDLTSDISADCGLVAAIDVLAAAGVAAEMVYDGDPGECPHCASQVLSVAA